MGDTDTKSILVLNIFQLVLVVSITFQYFYADAVDRGDKKSTNRKPIIQSNLLQKRIMFTFFGLIDDLLAEITSPTLEKSRSAGTDEQLMHRYFFTIGISLE